MADGGYASPLDFARAYAQLEDRERAFAFLDAALADRSPGLVFLGVDAPGTRCGKTRGLSRPTRSGGLRPLIPEEHGTLLNNFPGGCSMTTRLAAAAFLVIACAATTGDLLACGDKFLVVSRGTRYKHANTPRTPAVILIYANPATNLPGALANVQVDATLRQPAISPLPS